MRRYFRGESQGLRQRHHADPLVWRFVAQIDVASHVVGRRPDPARLWIVAPRREPHAVRNRDLRCQGSHDDARGGVKELAKHVFIVRLSSNQGARQWQHFAMS